MAVKSLKNLDSYSRGYIEGRTTKVDFSTSLSGYVKAQVANSKVITFKTSLGKNVGLYNEVVPQVGQVISGIGVNGIPHITNVTTNTSNETVITVNITQTDIPADTFLTLSDTNSGLDQFEITGSTLARSKEDLRIDQIVPSELLNYSSESTYDDNNSGGIKAFVDAYYKFMNTEEFLYKELETFEDIVINNISTIRIPDPDLKNNKFFSLNAAISAQIFDSDGNILTVGNNSTDFDIDFNNIRVLNVDNLPKISLEPNSGRTLTITGLPPRLNNKSITVIISVQNVVGAGPSFRLNTLEDALNINENDEELLDMMQKEIAPAVNQDIKVNKRALYQRLIDFYRIRGSKSSIDLFFKLFFQDEEIGIEYPWNSTLKTSMGAWDDQSIVAANYDKQPANVVASDAAAGDLFGSAISLDTNTNLVAVGSPSQEAATVDIATDAAANAGSNNRTIPLANTTGLQVGMVVTSVTDESNITADSKIASIIDGVSINLDKNIAENIGNGDTIRFTGQVDAGAVYVYSTSDSGSTYGSQVKIVSATGAAGDDFGSAVSLSGSVLAISAPDDTDNDGSDAADSGTVEIWERFLTQAPSTFTWRFQTKLKFTSGGKKFGNDISLDGNTLAVTVPGYEFVPTSTDGAVLIYKGTGASWTLSQTLVTPLQLNELGVDGWAEKVIIRGDYLFVSWPNSRSNKGSITIYHKDASTGLFNVQPEAILQPDELSANDLFGSAFDVDTNSNPIKPICAVTATGSRSVYVFERILENEQATWVNTAKLTPSVGQTNDLFGSSLKIYNNNILVGAPNSDGLGVTAVTDSGLIYHYELTDQWLEKTTYKETQSANNKFGTALEISRGSVFNLLVGAPGSSSGGQVVNFIRPARVGKYLNNEGFLSDKQKIQDSDFYQKFSYVIKAGRNISQWKDTYNKLVHPAGFKYFGEILIVVKAVRDILGDDTRLTTVTESVTNEFGVAELKERPLIAFSNSAQFRKTMSSMPGIQPGLTRDDLGLLIIALASFFSASSDGRANKTGRLSVVKLATGGKIPHDGISIVEAGAGYNTAPTVSVSEGTFASGDGLVTEVNQFGEIVDVIVKGGHPTTVSTPAAPTSFKFDGATNSSRDASSTKTGISTTTSGSGSNGVVTIVIGSDKTITSVTATTAGTGYKVGDVITVAGSALGGGTDLLLTVNEVHSGSGFSTNSAPTVQALSAVANSGVETAIGKVTDLTEITLASNPLTAGIFYKILDLGNATAANFNTISTDRYDRVKWKVGDVFQAASTGSGLSTTAKLQIAETGLTLNLSLNKKYRIPPIIEISAPDAIDSIGDPLSSNVNATARLTLNTEIPLDDTARLALNNRYIIAFKGNATDAQFNSIAREQRNTNPIETVDTIAMTHASTGAHAGEYFVTDGDFFTTGANGSGARFKITIDTSSNVKIKLIKGGAGYQINSTFTVLGSKFTDGVAGTNNLTFDVASLGNWKVGDTFEAIDVGTGLAAATTATVVLFNSTGKLTGFQITNAGLGYLLDPVVRLRSNSIHEKRVPNVIPVRIVTNGNDIQTITDTGKILTSSNPKDNYFGRKDYNKKAILGIKKFVGDYTIDQFASLSIENVNQSDINIFNANTTIQTVKDRNS